MQDKTLKSLTRSLLTAGAVLSVAAAAHAVTPGQFSHTTEADFADGDAEGAVITNLGDIKLSSDTTPIDGLPEDVKIVTDMVSTDDGIYLATGPDARVLLLRDGELIEVAKYEGEQVYAITAVGSDLFVGVSSSGNARVEFLDQGEVKATIKLPDETYIWDLAWIDDAIVGSDQIIIATGPEGRVYRVNEKDLEKPELLLDTQQSNILSLATDNKGNIYAGTDNEGLIYRIDQEGNPFVVYDAAEAEIAALTVMPDGTVYAGTADANQAKPGRIEPPTKEEVGRPVEDGQEQPAEEPTDKPAEDAEAPEDAGEGEAADAPDTEPEAEADAEPEAEEPAGEQEQAKPAKPSAEQYDALREELQSRLETARETGQLAGEVDQAAAPGGNNPGQAGRPSRAKPATPARKKPGNAVYRIAPDGFVTEVFRESAMIYAIAPDKDGKLIVATGSEGQVFSVDPVLRETTVLADLDSEQITCATTTDQGLLLGAANPGALLLMESAFAPKGTYTSQVLDAGQVSIFGTFKLTADIPKGTEVAVQLRSGNVGDPEQAAWSKWTQPTQLKHDKAANPLQPRELKIDVPPARYLQYRLTMTGDDTATPLIDQADLAYVAPNTPPTVAKLVVAQSKVGAPGSDPDPKVVIQWQATDDNSDRLLYSLDYKPGKADRWLSLAKDLTANKYDWQSQHVPDGWYTLRLTAHDKLDNPADSAKTGGRVSEPVLIDNTPPALEGLKAQVDGGTVKLTAKVTDELSPITSVAYSIDGSETYQASLPKDLIYDSTSEPWAATIPDLSPGGHVIAIRAIDARGNTAYRQMIVTVE